MSRPVDGHKTRYWRVVEDIVEAAASIQRTWMTVIYSDPKSFLAT